MSTAVPFPLSVKAPPGIVRAVFAEASNSVNVPVDVPAEAAGYPANKISVPFSQKIGVPFGVVVIGLRGSVPSN